MEKKLENLTGTTSFKDSKGNKKTISFDEMINNEAEQKLAGRVGNASGYSDLDKKAQKTRRSAFDISAQNASYST